MQPRQMTRHAQAWQARFRISFSNHLCFYRARLGLSPFVPLVPGIRTRAEVFTLW
jgi:hypothetical protein